MKASALRFRFAARRNFSGKFDKILDEFVRGSELFRSDVSSFIMSYFKRGVPTRESVDLTHASLLLSYYEWASRQSNAMEECPRDVLVKFNTENEELKQERKGLKKYTQKLAEAQVVKLYKAVKAVQVLKDGETLRSDNEDDDDLGLSMAERRKRVLTFHGIPTLVGPWGDFEVEVKVSGIKKAGEGLFVKRGSVCPGTVISLYPGLVHLTEHCTAEHLDTILPDPDIQLAQRLDQVIIDARTTHLVPQNPLALAHKVNHVPKGKLSNVMTLSFDYRNDPARFNEFPRGLRYLIPNTHAKAPTIVGSLGDIGIHMHGLVLIATRPLHEGDELLQDYRLHPNSSTLPPWYDDYAFSIYQSVIEGDAGWAYSKDKFLWNKLIE